MATIINEPTTRYFHDYHPPKDATNYDDAPEMPLDSDDGGMSENMVTTTTHISSNKAEIHQTDKNTKKRKVYQWNTKNTSFIELHKDLKKLGVENNKFFLRIYDETLMNVDPYSMVLPFETQVRVFVECIRNPWYFLREVCRIPVDGKPICPGGGAPFKLDRNNLATWYLFLNGLDHYSSKPRQRGKTQDALAKLNYAYHFGCVATTIMLGNKDFTLNKMNLSRLKTQRDLLPLYLQMKTSFNTETMKFEKEQNNVLSMGNPINHNKIQLLPSASTSDKAKSVGRGFTTALIMYDEFDWMKFNMEILYASSPAHRSAADNAKKNGSLYGRIFTSTPGNMDSAEGQDAEKLINGSTEEDFHGKPMLHWKDKYFDMPIGQLRSIATGKSYNGIIFVEHSWQQLKCSREWYKDSCRGVNYDPEQIAREILLKRLRGSGRSPFKRTQLMTLINLQESHIEEVDYSENLTPFLIYEKLNRKTPYLIGIDPAEGLKGDNLAFVMISPYTEKVVAEFKSSYVKQSKFANMLVRFMDAFCPRALIVIENNRGRELINRLLETKYANQLWFDEDKLDKREVINPKEFNPEQERAIGWNTGPKTRRYLMATLEDIVVEDPGIANSKYVVEDICALERVNGTIKAAPGKHDDVALAFAIVHTVYRQSTNLARWGIFPGMKEAPVVDKNSPEYKRSLLESLRDILPPDVAALFNSGVKKTAMHDQEKFVADIEKEAARMHLKDVDRHMMADDNFIDDAMLDNPDLFEEAMGEEFFERATYNPDADFDLNNFI